MEVYQQLTVIAESIGMTQYGIAKETGLSQPYVNGIFKGQKTPTLETLKKICSALGITLAEFFAEDEKQVDPMERQLLSAYRQLGDQQRSSLVAIADVMAVEYKKYEAEHRKED